VKNLIRPVCFALVICAATTAFGQATIERIAPEKSVLIVGTKNTQAMIDRVKGTPLMDLWKDEKIQSLIADGLKQMGEHMDTMFQELGVDDDSLVPPNGGSGLAIYPYTDEELSITKVGMLMFADYGDQAKADKTHALIQAVLTRGEKDGKLEFEEKDVNGRSVISIDLAKLKPAEGDDMDDDFGGNMPIPMPDPAEVFEGMEKLHYVRDGNVLMLSSNLENLTDALDLVDGKGGNETLANRPDFQAISGKLGETNAYAVVLTRDIMEIIGTLNPMAGMMQPMARASVGKVDGYGIGVQFDGPHAMVEQKLAIYMPEGKKGLTTLVDEPKPRAAIPSFVSQDAVSYSSVNFEFGGFMPVIREIVASTPMLQAQMGPTLDQMEPIVNQLTSALGSQIHMSSSYTRPFTATSQSSVTALECTKPQEFENAFAGLAAQGGFEARDFLGQRIFSTSPQMMPDGQTMSIGIGGGFVLIGPTTSVEQTLRATSEPAQATIAANADFQRAIATLQSQESIAWGYSDTVDALEATVAVEKAKVRKMIDDIREDDPEFAQEMEADLKKDWEVLDKFDFNMLRNYIGPTAWQIRSTPDGFEGNFYMLAAEGAKK
jgi:hypothetical protein